MQSSRSAIVKLMTTLNDGGYLGRSTSQMYGRVVTYDCKRRSYAMVLLHMKRMHTGTLTLDVSVVAVRALPERRCNPVDTVLKVILPICAVAAALVSLAMALAAIKRKRSEGHDTVCF